MWRRWLRRLAIVWVTLCVLVIVLWIRGHYVTDTIYYRDRKMAGSDYVGKDYLLELIPGWLVVAIVDESTTAGNPPPAAPWTRSPDSGLHWSRQMEPEWDSMDVWANQNGSGQRTRRTVFALEWQVAFVALLVLPAVWAYRRLLDYIRPKRSMLSFPPRCDNCGYDLRGSKGNCPECGTLIPFEILESDRSR